MSANETAAMTAEMARRAVPPRVRFYQYTALALIFISGIVGALDRATISIANPLIRKELGLSAGQMGLLLSAFLWGYAITQIPAGIFTDRWGPRRMLAGALVLWSVAQGLSGLLVTPVQFFMARAVVGVGEGPWMPSCVNTVRAWLRSGNRGHGAGVIIFSLNVGVALGPPVLTWLMLEYGWRWMFALMGILGLVVAAIWYSFYRDPASVGLTREEQAYLDDGAPPAPRVKFTYAQWWNLFRSRTTWGIVWGGMAGGYVSTIYLAWLPGYLVMERHLTIAQTGLAAAIPFTCGAIGGYFGGYTSDLLAKWGMDSLPMRKLNAVIYMVGGAVFTLAAAFSTSTVVAIVMISAGVFFAHGIGATMFTLSAVCAPPNGAGSLSSLQNLSTQTLGALAAVITGYIVEFTGSFFMAFVTGSVVAIVAAIGLWVLVRAPIPQN